MGQAMFLIVPPSSTNHHQLSPAMGTEMVKYAVDSDVSHQSQNAPMLTSFPTTP